jgi:IMP dehydrogenase/GMP reductase
MGREPGLVVAVMSVVRDAALAFACWRNDGCRGGLQGWIVIVVGVW